MARAGAFSAAASAARPETRDLRAMTMLAGFGRYHAIGMSVTERQAEAASECDHCGYALGVERPGRCSECGKGLGPRSESPLRCLECWYPIGAIDASSCPECGAVVLELARQLSWQQAWMSRQAVRGGWKPEALILGSTAFQVIVWALVFRGDAWVLYGSVALGLSVSTLLAGAVLVSGRGPVARGSDAAAERRLARRMWRQHAVWIAFPWMVVPALAMVFAVVSFLGRVLTPVGPNIEFVMGVLACPLWIILVIASYTRWTVGWNSDMDAAGLRSTEIPTRAGVACVLLGVVSFVFGGGTFAALGGGTIQLMGSWFGQR